MENQAKVVSIEVNTNFCKKRNIRLAQLYEELDANEKRLQKYLKDNPDTVFAKYLKSKECRS